MQAMPFGVDFCFSSAAAGKTPEDITTEEAAEFADFGNAVASVCVQKHGAIPAMPNMAQVMEQLKEERL